MFCYGDRSNGRSRFAGRSTVPRPSRACYPSFAQPIKSRQAARFGGIAGDVPTSAGINSKSGPIEKWSGIF